MKVCPIAFHSPNNTDFSTFFLAKNAKIFIRSQVAYLFHDFDVLNNIGSLRLAFLLHEGAAEKVEDSGEFCSSLTFCSSRLQSLCDRGGCKSKGEVLAHL